MQPTWPSGVERQGKETGLSYPCSTDIKNEWICTSTSPFAVMAWPLIKLTSVLFTVEGCLFAVRFVMEIDIYVKKKKLVNIDMEVQ